MKFCLECGKPNPEFKNAYGESLCEDCWDEYINSDRGKVEYFLSITRGEESLCAFDADFLCTVVRCWKENKNLLTLPEAEIVEAEEIAVYLQLFN